MRSTSDPLGVSNWRAGSNGILKHVLPNSTTYSKVAAALVLWLGCELYARVMTDKSWSHALEWCRTKHLSMLTSVLSSLSTWPFVCAHYVDVHLGSRPSRPRDRVKIADCRSGSL